MNKLMLPLIGLALILIDLAPAADVPGKVIDLKKPVGESLKPDGFYWSFDDGAVGESDPLTVVDLSENGFDGQIALGRSAVKPTYVEGVFGTGISVQDHPQITWKKNHKLDAAPDPSKLIMKGIPFTGGIWFKMDDRKPAAQVLIRRDDIGVGWRLIVVRDSAEDVESDGAAWFLDVEFGDSRDRSKSLASTSVFADGQWHHVGFSVSPETGGEGFTVVYWLDGEIFDTVNFNAAVPDPVVEMQFLSVGNGVWGFLDDAFVTTGIHAFKK